MNAEDIASQISVIFSIQHDWRYQISGVHVSIGSAETLAKGSGIKNHHLIAYSLSNISAIKLPKLVNVCWSYSVLHQCRLFETQCIYKPNVMLCFFTISACVIYCHYYACIFLCITFSYLFYFLSFLFQGGSVLVNSLLCQTAKISSTLCLRKNDNDVLRYNFNAHEPILIIFGRYIAEWIWY